MTTATSLQDLLRPALERGPHETAIMTLGSSVTYAEIDFLVRSVAGTMRRRGVQRGDRVVWLLPNCLEAVAVTCACYQIGAISVPLNYRYLSEEAEDIFQRVSPSLAVYHAEKADVVHPIRAARPNTAFFEVGSTPGTTLPESQPFSELTAGKPLDSPQTVSGEHPALILFTSGSTGKPKGVVHSHDGAFAAIDVSRQTFGFQAQDVALIGKPISHAGGLQTQLMAALSAGAKVVLAMKPTPQQAVDWIRKESVTEYGLLASDLLDFIEYLEFHPTPLPTLVNAIGSGDAVPHDLHQRFENVFGWQVMEGAGMTEVGGYYAANPRYGMRKWGSLGKPTPQTELRVMDSDGRDCAVGEPGEILVKAPSVTTGYWQDPAATDQLYQDGWLRTGDLARLDADGYVWFIGRKKLMIVRRGSNIAPAEVESVIDESPLVRASVVVGKPDPHDGQIPVAFVALLGKPTEETESQLRDYVSRHLAAYKNPVEYHFLETLPRNATGKLDRHQLQQWVLHGVTRPTD